MKIKITNKLEVDIMIDTKGENNIEDKIIIHPKMSTTRDVTEEVFNKIKSTKGLIINTSK